MFLFRVLYYQYFRFHKRFEQFGEEPHPHTKFALVFSMSPLIGIPLSFIATYFCYDPPGFLYILLPVLLLISMSILKMKGIDKKIEHEKPKIFKSSLISGIFAIFLFAFSFFLLVGTPIKEREYWLTHCNKCKAVK